MLRMLALTVRPVIGPDTRYRLIQYIPRFRELGIEVEHHSLYSPDYYRGLSRAGTVSKTLGLAPVLLRRLKDVLLDAHRFDVVWVGRELFPLGPLFLESLLFRRNPNVILDIDDAIYLPDPTNTGFVHRRLRDFRKFEKGADRFKAVVCGNDFLADYFRPLNANVSVIPTVVEAARYAAVERQPSDMPCIGWIGTPTNAHHLRMLRGPLTTLARDHRFRFRMVGLNEPLDWKIPNMEYVPWSLDGELDFFAGFDIGVMPLEDTPFTRGKCAFKLIQYMASGIPVAASPVGSNLSVVEEGVNGFLADNEEAWEQALAALLTNGPMRERMGENGRRTVQERFSLEAHAESYAEIIRSCA